MVKPITFGNELRTYDMIPKANQIQLILFGSAFSKMGSVAGGKHLDFLVSQAGGLPLVLLFTLRNPLMAISTAFDVLVLTTQIGGRFQLCVKGTKYVKTTITKEESTQADRKLKNSQCAGRQMHVDFVRSFWSVGRLTAVHVNAAAGNRRLLHRLQSHHLGNGLPPP